MVPSDRVIVPRSLAFALPDAVGEPVVVTGGHAPAHAPVHADVPPVSLTHRYTARPDPSVRNVAPEDVAVRMTAALPLLPAAGELAPDAAAELAGAAEELLLPLEHAAARTATPTAPPAAAASLAPADIRFTLVFRITFVSRLTHPQPSGTRSSVTVTTGTE